MNQSNLSDSDAQFSAYMLTIQQELIFYWTLLVLNVSFMLNICMAVVFMRKKFAKNPMALYNVYIAYASNTCVIIMYFSFFPQAYGLNLTAYSDFSCKFISYTIRVFTQMISWLHTLLSMDRMVSVLSPTWHLSLKTPTFTKASSLVLFVALLAVNLENMWFKKLDGRPTPQCTSDSETSEARDMINIVMRTLLPMALMLVANNVLIVSLFKQKHDIHLDRSMKREISFSVSVLVQNLLFVVFMVPQAVSVIYQYNADYRTSKSSPVSSTRLGAIINLCMACANVLATYTICCSFLVNLVFNKLFRDELRVVARILLSMVSPKYAASLEMKRTSTPAVHGHPLHMGMHSMY